MRYPRPTNAPSEERRQTQASIICCQTGMVESVQAEGEAASVKAGRQR